MRMVLLLIAGAVAVGPTSCGGSDARPKSAKGCKLGESRACPNGCGEQVCSSDGFYEGLCDCGSSGSGGSSSGGTGAAGAGGSSGGTGLGGASGAATGGTGGAATGGTGGMLAEFWNCSVMPTGECNCSACGQTMSPECTDVTCSGQTDCCHLWLANTKCECAPFATVQGMGLTCEQWSKGTGCNTKPCTPVPSCPPPQN